MDCDELYVSFLFPPSDYVSGITVFKRIVENNQPVDVLQSNFKSDDFLKFDELADDYVSDRIIVDMDCRVDWTECIFKFIKRGIDAIDKDYKRIYSRSWLMANHFLACEYKFTNPEVLWTAEFSDPLIYDLSNNPKYYKKMEISDNTYISKINKHISKFNQLNDTDYPPVEKNAQAYFICEYLVYLFSDRVIFTNENQRRIMLDQFPHDVRELVSAKSQIKRHPTLPDKFYHINDVELDLDNDFINMAYFGNDYYAKRHFESLFYSVGALNHKYKDKLRIHLYISDTTTLNNLVPSDNFTVKKPLGYLDFLNATTKYDVLIVSDAVTKGDYDLNPYLPSKLSDYLGAGRDIWALYENDSSMSEFDLKYKSCINDYDACLAELVRILDDYGFGDETYGVDENYIKQRLTKLNVLYEGEVLKKRKYKRQVKKLKKTQSENKSSNSWNIRKSLRKIRK